MLERKPSPVELPRVSLELLGGALCWIATGGGLITSALLASTVSGATPCTSVGSVGAILFLVPPGPHTQVDLSS